MARIAAILTLLMLGSFAVAVAVNLRRKSGIACGCFGDSEPISARTLVRIALLAFGVLGSALQPATGGASGEVLISAFALSLLLISASTWLLHVREVRLLMVRGR